MAGNLYLDDLHVGQRFTSGKAVVTAEEIKRFAAQFDPQPFHLDEATAANSMFGGLAASGWHTGALTWPRPTRPGDELQVFSEVTEITPSRSKPDRGIVAVRSETRNQRGEVLQILTSKLVVFRKPENAR